MKGVFKKWKQWGDVDENGNYWVDNEGVPSKQADCKEPIQCTVNGVPCKPEWDDLSDWRLQFGAVKVAVRRTLFKNELVDAVIPIHKRQFRLKRVIHWTERLKKPEKSV